MNELSDKDWLKQLDHSLPRYLQAIGFPDQPGRFLPCLHGLTPEGRMTALGFSCFALKLYYTLGLWEKLDSQEKTAWIAFLKSFQVGKRFSKDRVCKDAFIDPVIFGYLAKQIPWYKRITLRNLYPKYLTCLQMVIIAETKQSVATLAQVGESIDQPYRGFPQTEKEVMDYIVRLDWTHPWGAGAHTSALAVFLKTQAPRCLKPEETQRLLNACGCFIESIVDMETGAYYKGTIPEHGVLINGAMKILTALDWLEVPIHYPERLIDTCLKCLPSSDGCHLVDAVYVIYRCLQQTQHRKEEVQTYCLKVLEMIKEHHNSDGGFSYYIGRSQKYYYGVPISQGFAESDIHGTSLLIWAITMIVEIMAENALGWRVIRP